MPVMTQRGYARYRRVNPSAVQKAIQTGRISAQPDGSIDSEQADIEWSQNTTRRAPPVDKHGYEQDGSPFYGTSQYTKARAVRENYQARLAKVEYEERVGNLVPKDEVELAAFNEFRQFRDRMLNIPARVAAMLAAETDPAKCHEILAAEVRQALNEFAENDS